MVKCKELSFGCLCMDCELAVPMDMLQMSTMMILSPVEMMMQKKAVDQSWRRSLMVEEDRSHFREGQEQPTMWVRLEEMKQHLNHLRPVLNLPNGKIASSRHHQIHSDGHR